MQTPLSEWMRLNGRSYYWVAQQLGMTGPAILKLSRGDALPNVVTAFQIERLTQGAVPVASWLGTERGKYRWRHGVAKQKRHL